MFFVFTVKPVVRTNKVGNVLEGVTTDLRCHVDGIPQPDIQWQVAKYDMPTNDSHRYSTDSVYYTYII